MKSMIASMNKLKLVPVHIGLCIVGLGVLAFSQEEHLDLTEEIKLESKDAQVQKLITNKDKDIDKLYELIRQARADLEVMRKRAGIKREKSEGRREGRGEHSEGRREGREEGKRKGREGKREGRGEHGEVEREGRGEHGEGGREGRGEHGEGGREGGGESSGGEEGGIRIEKNAKWDATRNGAHLIIAYNATTQSFKGIVKNMTAKILKDVRVEVHLSNGVELGPTKRTDLKPGAIIPVELSAANQKFSWWTTHPEHGSEPGHGPESEEGVSHEGSGNRPNDPALRPLYNQIMLLRREINIIAEGLMVKNR